MLTLPRLAVFVPRKVLGTVLHKGMIRAVWGAQLELPISVPAQGSSRSRRTFGGFGFHTRNWLSASPFRLALNLFEDRWILRFEIRPLSN